MHLTRLGSLASTAPSDPSSVGEGLPTAETVPALADPAPRPLAPLSPSAGRSIEPSPAGSRQATPCCAAALHPGGHHARSLEQALSQALSLARESNGHAPTLLLDLRPFPASSVRDIPSDIWHRLAGQVRAVQMPPGWTSRDVDWLSALREVDMIECIDLPSERHPFHGLPRSVSVVITPEPHPDWRCAEHRHRLFLSTAESAGHAYLNAFSSQHADAAAWTLRLAADGPQDHWPSAEHYARAAEAAQQLAVRARAHMPHGGQDLRGWLVPADQAKLIDAVIQRSPVTLLSPQGRAAMLALQHQTRLPGSLTVLSSWQLHVIDVAIRAAVDALLLPGASPPAIKPVSALMELAQRRYLEAEALQPPSHRCRPGRGLRPPPHILSRTFSAPAPATHSPPVGHATPPRWSTGPLHFHSTLPQTQQNLSMAEALLLTPWACGPSLRAERPTRQTLPSATSRPRREPWLAQVVQHVLPALPRPFGKPPHVPADAAATTPALTSHPAPNGASASRVTTTASPREDLVRATLSAVSSPSTERAADRSGPQVTPSSTPVGRRAVAPPPSEPLDEVDGPLDEVDGPMSGSDPELSEPEATAAVAPMTDADQTPPQRSSAATNLAMQLGTNSLDRRRPPAPWSSTDWEPAVRSRLGSGSLIPASTAARGGRARPASIAGHALADEPSRDSPRTRAAPLARAESDLDARTRRQPLLSRLRKLLSPPRRAGNGPEERFPTLPPLPPAAPLTAWKPDRVPTLRAADDAPTSVVASTSASTAPATGRRTDPWSTRLSEGASPR